MTRRVLSLDLAYKSYDRIGFCLLDGSRSSSKGTFLLPKELGLTEKPDPIDLADAILKYCTENEIKIALFDGPQAWKDPASDLSYRRCERELFTQGKTGTCGNAKPQNFLSFTQFSVNVFHRLIETNCELVRSPPIRVPENLLAVETFPTSAWRCLGQKPLAGKSKATEAEVAQHADDLQKKFNLAFEECPSHDQVQAAVAGLAGLSILAGDMSGYCLSGSSPVLVNGVRCEGYIVNPRLTMWDKV